MTRLDDLLSDLVGAVAEERAAAQGSLAAAQAQTQAAVAERDAAVARLDLHRFRVGAAIGGNADPAPFEQRIGATLGVRRTYYSQVAAAVKAAAADVAAGRMPWISLKFPVSWQDAAAGKADAWALDLAQRLAAVPGPVWLALHHEPEGDGDILVWKAAQERLAPIVKAAAPNVVYTVIFTGFDVVNVAQYTLSRIWPDAPIDVGGFDTYQYHGTPRGSATKWTDLVGHFDVFADWCRPLGIPWAIAETGYTAAQLTERPTLIRDDVGAAAVRGCVAWCYFNSTINSVAPWAMEAGGPRETAFGEVARATA